MKLAKKLTLFTIILFLPFSLFYFFSLGKHHFERLPFLGPEKDGKAFTYPEQKIFSVTGEELTDSLKGKTLIVNTLNAAYPNGAAFYIGAFKQIVLGELQSNVKYKNVVVVSEIHQGDSASKKLLYDKFSIPGKWYVIEKPQKSYFDVDNGDGNLLQIKDPTFPDLMLYERLNLIVDKDLHFRACQDLTEGIKSKTLIDELRLLMKEYYKDYGAY